MYDIDLHDVRRVVLLTRSSWTVSKASQVCGSKLISGAGGPAVLADEPPRRGHDVLLVAAPLVVVHAEVVAHLVRHDVDSRQPRRGVRLARGRGRGAQLADDAVPRAGADLSNHRTRGLFSVRGRIGREVSAFNISVNTAFILDYYTDIW